jgi:hypothetical protein
MSYSLTWTRIIRQTLMGAIARSPMLEWLLALISPVAGLHNALLTFRARVLESITITGQVCRLRTGLNDRFDPISRRIYIIDQEEPSPLFIFLESENRPVYLPVFITGSAVEFLVMVPAELAPDEQLIRQFLNAYKLVTKRYRLQYF